MSKEQLAGLVAHISECAHDGAAYGPDLRDWHERLSAILATLPEPGVVSDEAHCATCTCVPGMTPAVRFDASPAEREGAVREHLISMGWTPPGEDAPPAQGFDAEFWKKAWVEERARAYRREGMTVEQAKIHAETDAASALAAAAKGVGHD